MSYGKKRIIKGKHNRIYTIPYQKITYQTGLLISHHVMSVGCNPATRPFNTRNTEITSTFTIPLARSLTFEIVIQDLWKRLGGLSVCVCMTSFEEGKAVSLGELHTFSSPCLHDSGAKA
jgi:hypothetical protein